MESLTASPTNQNTDCDDFHVPTKLTGLKAMRWLKARQRAEARIRAAVFAITRDFNISRQVPKALRQHIYDYRTDRRSMSEGFFRVTEVVALSGANVSSQQAWAFLDEVWRAEREAAEAVLGPSEPGPGGRKADDLPATKSTVQVRDIRGVTLGSCDALGWHEWKPAA